jgi:hypothetical protein
MRIITPINKEYQQRISNEKLMSFLVCKCVTPNPKKRMQYSLGREMQCKGKRHQTALFLCMFSPVIYHLLP